MHNTGAIPKKRAVRNSRKTKVDVIFDITNVILLAVITLVILYPLWYCVIASFSNPLKVAAGSVYLMPVEPTLENYREVFKNEGIMRGYGNSLVLLITGVLICLYMTVSCAYPLSRRDVWGRGFLMKAITFTMFFSGGMIPNFLLVSKTLGLQNSWWSLWLTGALSAYNMIIMRTFFATSIPYEIQEAATIDGCTPYGTLLHVILPLSGPIIAVVGLYYGVGIWNSYFNALLYITDRTKWPLQLYLREVLVSNSNQNLMDMSADEMARQAMRAETIKFSVIILSSVPMLIAYPFVQRFFVKGVMIGSVKG